MRTHELVQTPNLNVQPTPEQMTLFTYETIGTNLLTLNSPINLTFRVRIPTSTGCVNVHIHSQCD